MLESYFSLLMGGVYASIFTAWTRFGYADKITAVLALPGKPVSNGARLG